MLFRSDIPSVWPFFVSNALFPRSIVILSLRSRIQWKDIPKLTPIIRLGFDAKNSFATPPVIRIDEGNTLSFCIFIILF